LSWPVDALMASRGETIAPRKKSAIRKRPLDGPVAIGPLGLAGDDQIDKRHHGGLDMAVHHYPHDHFAFWREAIGDHPLLAEPGAFGSNLSAAGLTEADVLLGDRFRLGSVLLEACQPRQPCATIERSFVRKGMVAAILDNGRCGWFYRVIEPGEAAAGDRLDRAGRGDAAWSMADLFDALWSTRHARERMRLRSIAQHPLIPAKLSAKILARL